MIMKKVLLGFAAVCLSFGLATSAMAHCGKCGAGDHKPDCAKKCEKAKDAKACKAACDSKKDKKDEAKKDK